MLDQITESCKYLLHNYPNAQESKDYLDSRLNSKSQELFQFGYFPPVSNIATLTSLVGEDSLKKLKLFYEKVVEDSQSSRKIKYCYFENYPLIMPFRDAYGNIVALVGRTLLSDDEREKKRISKYKNTVFPKGSHLFGLYEAKRNIIEQDSVYIVEGQFDVIKSMENGFNNIVALGTNRMTAYQFSVITRYTSNIFLLLDNDENGEIGREGIMKKFGDYANIRNFYLPKEYKDIDEFFQENSLDSLSFIVGA